jgi:hypothetical protein
MPAPIVLTKRELYDLVWSKPMRDLAAELGISDVGLAKVCDRHRVPKPERGHWNKIQAGQKTKKAVFVESDDAWLNRIEIRGALPQIPEAARKVIEDAKATRKALVRKIEPPLAGLVTPVAELHKSVLRTACSEKVRPTGMAAFRPWEKGSVEYPSACSDGGRAGR